MLAIVRVPRSPRFGPVDSGPEVSLVRDGGDRPTPSRRCPSGAAVDDDTIQHEATPMFAEHLVPEAFATATLAQRVSRETQDPVHTDRTQARTLFGSLIDAGIEDPFAGSSDVSGFMA